VRTWFCRKIRDLHFICISGLFIPEEGKPPIWELVTDYYLHHQPACRYSRKKKLLTQWWDKNVLKCLPYALNEVTKSCSEMIQVQSSMEEMIDVYYDYHRYQLIYDISYCILQKITEQMFADRTSYLYYRRYTHIK